MEFHWRVFSLSKQAAQQVQYSSIYCNTPYVVCLSCCSFVGYYVLSFYSSLLKERLESVDCSVLSNPKKYIKLKKKLEFAAC